MIRYTRNKKLNLILLYTFIEIINHNPSNKIHPKFYSTYYIYVLLIPYKLVLILMNDPQIQEIWEKEISKKNVPFQAPELSKQWHVSVSGMYDDEYSGFRYWYWCRSHGTIRRAREFLARPETANHRNIGCSSYAKNRSAGSRFIPKIENLLERGRLVAHISTVFRLHGNELQASFFFLLLSRSFSLFLFFRFIRQFAFLYSFEIG